MKLIFKEKYLSIDNFKDVDLPDLAVLTGVNGSGKSHLLESIQQKKSIIEGLENANIIYFNYETFKLEGEAACAAHQISSERENAWVFFEQQIKNNIVSWKTQFLGQNYEKIIDICEKKQRDLWFLSEEDIDDNNLYENIQKYKQHINANFKNNNLKDNKQAQAILVLCKDIKYCISDMQKNQFITLYKPYYFKSNFLPQQIGQIIWDYYVKFRNNQVNVYENEKNKKEYPAITESEFIKKHGDKPWEVINKILDKFNSLDYKINSPEGSSSSDSFQLKLIHSTKKIEVGFETLSSGEKVLMALVASVYKSSSDKHFPDILLLDEIDASLHPSMIKNLFEVIQDIFLKKKIKVILVTHSPTTVAIAPDKSIFVMNKASENRIEKKSKEKALSILSEGFVSLSQSASDLSISYNISKATKNILLTEGITDKIIIETAWNKLFPRVEMPFYIQDCFDAIFLKNLLKRGAENPDGIFVKYAGKRFIALFDFDGEGYNSWNDLWHNQNNNLITDPRKGLTKKHSTFLASALLLPVPRHNSLETQVIENENNTYKDKAHLTIELLFYGVASLNDHFKEKKIAGGGTLIEFIGNKRRFSENCVNLSLNDFDNFKILFESIQNILDYYEKK